MNKQTAVKIPSHVATILPDMPAFKLTDDSIIIVESDGKEFVVGATATRYNPDGGRVFGGSVKDRHYQRLVCALLAKGLGEGDHEITMGLSAAKQFIDEFRAHKGSTALNDEAVDMLAGVVKEIKYKVGSSDSPTKTCRVSLKPDESVHVLFETEAVCRVIPKKAKTYLLMQIGGGDWQSVVVVDGNMMHNTHSRVEGVSGAQKKLASLLKLSRAETQEAWISETRPNGMGGKRECCIVEKTRAANAYIFEQIPGILNNIEGYTDRIKAVVVSGGAVNDETFMSQLKEEMPQSLRVFTIKELHAASSDDESTEIDPVFACAYGLASLGVSAALDIGNSHLKGVFNVQ